MVTRQFYIILLLISFSCKSQDEISYKLIQDIRRPLNIKYIDDSTIDLNFLDSTGRQEFIRLSSKYINPDELIEILNDKVNPIEWNKSKLGNIACVSSDSVLKINQKTKKYNSLSHISTPVYNKTKTFAILLVFNQLPDENILYGGRCVYLFQLVKTKRNLFHRAKNKWTEVLRADCVDY